MCSIRGSRQGSTPETGSDWRTVRCLCRQVIDFPFGVLGCVSKFVNLVLAGRKVVSNSGRSFFSNEVARWGSTSDHAASPTHQVDEISVYEVPKVLIEAVICCLL